MDDPIESAPVDDKIFDDREGRGAPGFNEQFVTGFELAHVQLADGGAAAGAVSDAVDDKAAGTANSFTAVMVEGDGDFAFAG